jgi:hypothetical protein
MHPTQTSAVSLCDYLEFKGACWPKETSGSSKFQISVDINEPLQDMMIVDPIIDDSYCSAVADVSIFEVVASTSNAPLPPRVECVNNHPDLPFSADLQSIFRGECSPVLILPPTHEGVERFLQLTGYGCLGYLCNGKKHYELLYLASTSGNIGEQLFKTQLVEGDSGTPCYSIDSSTGNKMLHSFVKAMIKPSADVYEEVLLTPMNMHLRQCEKIVDKTRKNFLYFCEEPIDDVGDEYGEGWNSHESYDK